MEFLNKKLSDETIERYVAIVEKFEDYLKLNNLEMTFENIQQWLSTIKNSNTYNICFAAIKSYLLELYKDKSDTEINKLMYFFKTIAWKKPKKTISEMSYLSKEQIDELVNYANTRIAYFVKALFQTGCRVSELINIKLNNCIIKQKYVYIKISGKGGQEREVWLHNNLFKDIVSEFNSKQYLFETVEGNCFKREYVSKQIKKVAKKLGHENISAHSLRHSKAMYLKNKGMSAYDISKALGHVDLSTTQKYYFHDTPTPDEQLGDL